MDDDQTEVPSQLRPSRPSAEPPAQVAPGFEQLALGATVTGPARRSEDHYEPGARLRIKGERGVFTYKHASLSKAGMVSLHLSGEGGSRAVRPDQVVPVRKKRPK